MIGMIPYIVWDILLTALVIVNPHPHLDMHRCYMDRAAFTKFCWPKDGCWLDVDGSATCWRVVKVKKAN